MDPGHSSSVLQPILYTTHLPRPPRSQFITHFPSLCHPIAPSSSLPIWLIVTQRRATPPEASRQSLISIWAYTEDRSTNPAERITRALEPPVTLLCAPSKVEIICRTSNAPTPMQYYRKTREQNNNLCVVLRNAYVRLLSITGHQGQLWVLPKDPLSKFRYSSLFSRRVIFSWILVMISPPPLKPIKMKKKRLQLYMQIVISIRPWIEKTVVVVKLGENRDLMSAVSPKHELDAMVSTWPWLKNLK